ncbi:hypothetical protein SEA_BRUHMOMENT_67 [Arthrobacter phage BruhMoment]|nr:hypothetical protein SEA_BRUHMOMENT_67 [Arthrobacter phage BruhMoment]
MTWETFFVAVGYFILFLLAYLIIAVTVAVAAQNRHKRNIEWLEAQARNGVRSE